MGGGTLNYGDRLRKEALSKPAILAAIRASGCEVEPNHRPGPGGMFDLCPAARLMRFFPDFRFRWPGSEWGLFDTKASDLIELAAWATYMDLFGMLGRYHVIVAGPYGWSAIEQLRLIDRPEGGFHLADLRGHQWACPRLDSSQTNGSGTPYSQALDAEGYGRWGMIRPWLALCEETKAFNAMYELKAEPI